LVSTLALLVGCGHGGEGEAGEPEGVGYVLMDLEAKEAGFKLDGIDEDLMLPTQLDAGDSVDLVGPDATIVIDVAVDELVWIRTSEGIIEHRAFDYDVSRDVLFVSGSEEAAKAIASQMNGLYEREEEGLWRVSAADAFQHAAKSAMPSGLDEVLPAVAPELSAKIDSPSNETRQRLLDAVPARRLLSFDLADNLPIYELLTPPVSCEDPVAGIWVSRAYFASHDDWYVFTMEIRRDAEDATQLAGRIRSRSWSGDVAIDSPEACDMLPPSHFVDPFDFTVAMAAEGTFHSGNVTFGGTSWKTTSLRCGPQHQWFGYNLDNFTGVVSQDGRWMSSVNNDGGRSVNDDHDFRRISCL
jgi:hypothetical protein